MIKLLLTDVDGVMTTGGVTITSEGWEQMTFNIRDGLGIRLWQRAGRRFGIVTGRQTAMVALRSKKLDIDIVHQGVTDKLPIVQKIAKEQGVTLGEIAYVGDDLPDLPVIRAVGLGVAVVDAAAEVQAGADHVLDTPGGYGALRELIEMILKQENAWDKLLAAYTD